jgi:hypothetical protein
MGNRFVYPIFKNGSSSLKGTNPPIISKSQIRNRVARVHVYLREPFERYVSGVQTYLRHNPHLDRTTALTMIDQYLFLNRHFALQFHWLVNLVRHTNDPWITFNSIDDLGDITDLTWNALERDETILEYFQSNEKLQFYLQLDKILLEFVGRTVKFVEILTHVEIKHPALYEEVVQRSRNLCAVLG